MTKSDDIQVLLLRTGRTEWDEMRRLQGKRDLPMTDAGCDALTACLATVLSRFETPSFSSVFCAPDEASRVSAAQLADQTGAKLKVTEDLAAMDLGIWEGLLETDLTERYPSAFSQWKEDPSQVRPPEGDAFFDVELHVLATIAKAVERAGSKPLAFVLRPLEYGMARCLLMERPVSDLWSLVEDGPDADLYTIPRATVRALLEQRKAST